MVANRSFDTLKQFIQNQGWRWQPGKSIPHGEQMVVSDGQHQATINFYPKRNSFVSGGPNSPLKVQLDAWIKGIPSPTPIAASAEPLEPAGTRLDALKAYLKEQDWNWGPGTEIPYGEQIVVSDAGVTVLVNYWPKHGKMQVQGGDSPLKAALQAWVTGENQAASTEPTMITGAHIGLDESGKGDWFGGPVVAAVYVDDQTAAMLRRMGVRDSKALDAVSIQRLAAQIAGIVPAEQRHVWAIEPETYNLLYAKHHNTDLLLADIYAQVAEKVWRTTQAQVIVCDQFAQRLTPLEQAFATRGLPQPRQQHHAEAVSIAVAAASILASAAFSDMLARLGAAVGLDGPLPKGSSDEARLMAAAQHIIKQQGPEALGYYAKLNFKPIRQLLGEDVTRPAASQAVQGRPGSIVTIEQPAWQMQYHPNGFWRFTFTDGGMLDWYSDSNGKLDVRGKANAPSFVKLKEIAHGKTIAPGKSYDETWQKLEKLEARVKELFPHHCETLPSVLEVGWQRKDTVLGFRFDFTDGGILQYYTGSDKLLLQGKPSPLTQKVLTALLSPFWPGPEILTENLKTLFPDWRLGQALGPAGPPEADPTADLAWEPLEDSLNWNTFWPESRLKRLATNMKAPCQKELAEDWASVLVHHQGKRHLLAHGPTGLGKTLAALVPALAWVAQAPSRRRLYYLVNRVTQHANPIRELKNGLAATFTAQTGQPLRVVDIVGRTLLCHDPQVRQLSDLCKHSRGEASFDLLPQAVSSWDEIRTHLGRRACPYHTLQGLMSQAHIVICDYWWLFSQIAQESSLLSRAGFSATDTILIVDEAHNLPLRVRSELDVDETVAKIEADLQQAPPAVIACLTPVVATVRQVDPGQGTSPSALLAIAGGREAVKLALATLTEDELSEGPGTLPERMLRLLLQPDEAVVIYPTPDMADEPHLVFRLVDPTPVLQTGYHQVYASLSMSGTLAAPADNSEELRYQVPLFGLPLAETLTHKYASPFALRNQRWIYSTDTYGAYRHRHDYFPRYAEHIVSVGQSTPGVTAVFFSSYAFLAQVQAQITDAAEQSLIVAETQADAEGKIDAGSNLSNYEERLKALVGTHERAYLFAVYKGKLSEGADFANNLIKSVVCISIPLEYPGLYHQRLEAIYQEKFAPIAGETGDDVRHKAKEYALDRLSLSLVLQACGRGIRSSQDRCAFILLDKRYDEYEWRRFLEPRPYQLLKTAETVERFHQSTQSEIGQAWDSVLLAACQNIRQG